MIAFSTVVIAADILERVTRGFDQPDEAQLALTLLEEFVQQNPELSGERLVRCIVQVANGDLELLGNAVRLATVDYRDLIVWAEYDEDRVRIRDLSQPFQS